jgi:ABC-type transport system substrate-binding protein
MPRKPPVWPTRLHGKPAVLLVAASALAMTSAMPALAKTFVYCSEASPEGFDPAPYTAGGTFDASAHPIYNRLVEFKKGTTEIEPGLAESWEVSADGTGIHLPPAQGREVAFEREVHPHPRLQRR